MNKERLLATTKRLCGIFGPSGCEERVAEAILAECEGLYDELVRDSFGNVIMTIHGDESKPPIMLSAHMDEVGFMISDIDEHGYLHFCNVGGISPAVLPGRRVMVEQYDTRIIPGVICSKAIHLQNTAERERPSMPDKLLIDIGADSREHAMEITGKGCFATFDSDYTYFGKDNAQICSKALDDRVGCAVLTELMHCIHEGELSHTRTLCFSFSVREELGLSGALVAANRIKPEYSLVAETTAISDIGDTPEEKRVARAGDGCCILFADRSTIYDRELFSLACRLARENGVKHQIKKFVSGGNDSAHIQRSSAGVRSLAISAPARDLHSASCVVNADDCMSIAKLFALLIEKLN